MIKTLKILLILILLFTSFYIAIAGWVATDALNSKSSINKSNDNPVVYNGITFATAEEAEAYRKEILVGRWFPWIWDQPVSSLFIACIGFGLLGGIIRLLRNALVKSLPNTSRILLIWLLSGAMGLVLFFLIGLLFEAKSGKELIFYGLSLLSGIFSEETYDWLATKTIGIYGVFFPNQK